MGADLEKNKRIKVRLKRSLLTAATVGLGYSEKNRQAGWHVAFPAAQRSDKPTTTKAKGPEGPFFVPAA